MNAKLAGDGAALQAVILSRMEAWGIFGRWRKNECPRMIATREPLSHAAASVSPTRRYVHCRYEIFVPMVIIDTTRRARWMIDIRHSALRMQYFATLASLLCDFAVADRCHIVVADASVQDPLSS